MFKGTVLCIPRSAAIRHAAKELDSLGIRVTDKCAPDVTHLLLPVPSFPSGDGYLAHLLAKLPEDVIISGGNMNSPLLEGYRYIDYLQDPYYLADNAAITAACALTMLSELAGHLDRKQALIIGWGRIGKCLGPMLKEQGVQVTIGARKPGDLAMIHALGYHSLALQDASSELKRFDLILNTVPVLLFPQAEVREPSVILELASKPGITGPAVIDARGLPGKMAPEQSGKLIAKTFIRLSI